MAMEEKVYFGKTDVLWGNANLRVRRRERGTEQLVGLIPVGLQHGLESFYQLHPLLLQLLVRTL
jgi:hypothetical protein